MSDLWMVNVRMRRVEQIQLHPRAHQPNKSWPKCYQGPGRTYMLHESQVHLSRSAALEKLNLSLQAIYEDRRLKQQKLFAEIQLIAAELESQP
ncbi:hypothetical protein [Pseudomonas asplenii]|uniref:Uncharacterized protein n=1 Tax=Pseudomonas asplenii TaxID=53407 RepID=A0A1H6NMB9_9PSED|nr:hypothetical protein [Pseudomonas fuscovaginae]SEI17000.1 hypothetical protein SAMN05216581_3282 [Pseudomonas fuscovaginae]